MKKVQQGHQVKVSEFKTHLGKYLKDVKSGQEITVLDRATPVAKLVPFVAETDIQVHVVAPSQNWHEVRKKWLKKNPSDRATQLKKSSLEYLKDDRDFK